MNGKFLYPLTGLNDFDILGAAPIIREKNKRANNVNTPLRLQKCAQWHGK